MASKVLSEKAVAFLAKNPTLIGRVGEYEFYECPVNGDEVALKMITPDGKIKRSDFWEMPSLEDLYLF